jgi:hypothetical protein
VGSTSVPAAVRVITSMPLLPVLDAVLPGNELGIAAGFLCRRNCRWGSQGLTETGYIEGQNVVLEYRWAENQFDRLPAMAAELAQRKVSVIVAGGSRFRLWPQKRLLQQFQLSL